MSRRYLSVTHCSLKRFTQVHRCTSGLSLQSHKGVSATLPCIGGGQPDATTLFDGQGVTSRRSIPSLTESVGKKGPRRPDGRLRYREFGLCSRARGEEAARSLGTFGSRDVDEPIDSPIEEPD